MRRAFSLLPLGGLAVAVAISHPPVARETSRTTPTHEPTGHQTVQDRPELLAEVIPGGTNLAKLVHHRRTERVGISTLPPVDWAVLIPPAPVVRDVSRATPPTPAPVAPAAVTVTVTPGDTLSGLAAAHGVTVAQLGRANGVVNPNVIDVGQVLTVPATTYVAAPYPVQPVANQLQNVSETYVSGTFQVAPTSAFEACVIQRESGGNPDVWNPSGHWGAFQFSYSTWVANGGDPATFGSASFSEQQQVFLRSSPSNWTPWDGCVA